MRHSTNQHRQRGASWVPVVIIVLLLIVGGIVVLRDGGTAPSDGNGPSVIDGIDTSEWQVYENTTYDFQIRHPETWNVASDFQRAVPMISIYPTEGATSTATTTPPFDHFENQTHVSVYPRGIPTEGVFAPRATSSVSMNPEVREGQDLTLQTGEVFARVFRFSNPPASWNDAGFVWSRTRIDNLETQCLRDGEAISQMECDPLVTGDEIIWNGTVDEEVQRVQDVILQTFEFIEPQENDQE